MWKVTNSDRPFLLLLREPNGTAGCVGGLEVGLGSLVWDCMLRGRIPREGCTDFQPELPMLPFLSVADFIFHGVFLADTGCEQHFFRNKLFCTRFCCFNSGELSRQS